MIKNLLHTKTHEKYIDDKDNNEKTNVEITEKKTRVVLEKLKEAVQKYINNKNNNKKMYCV